MAIQMIVKPEQYESVFCLFTVLKKLSVNKADKMLEYIIKEESNNWKTCFGCLEYAAYCSCYYVFDRKDYYFDREDYYAEYDDEAYFE